MPVIKSNGGFKCGTTGKKYRSKKKAATQCRAIKASQKSRRKKNGY